MQYGNEDDKNKAYLEALKEMKQGAIRPKLADALSLEASPSEKQDENPLAMPEEVGEYGATAGLFDIFKGSSEESEKPDEKDPTLGEKMAETVNEDLSGKRREEELKRLLDAARQ